MNKGFVFTVDSMAALAIVLLIIGGIYFFNLNSMKTLNDTKTIQKMTALTEASNVFFTNNSASDSLGSDENGFCGEYLKYDSGSFPKITRCVTFNE